MICDIFLEGVTPCGCSGYEVLELALNGEAQYIITGDRDLLVLNPFRNVRVITVEDFLKTI